MVKNSIPFSKKIGLVTEPVVALKRTMKVKTQQKSIINLVIAVGETKEKVIGNIKKYTVEENIKKAFELSKAKNEAQRAMEQMASGALRVIALAMKKKGDLKEEKDLVFLGLAGMMDPPREGVA